MPIEDYLNQSASIVTRSDWTLFNAAATATLTLTARPTRDFRLKVAVSGGTNNTGVVSATGSLKGSPKSETLTFAGASTQNGTVLFDTLAGITTTGLADETKKPTITVTCIDSVGAPIKKETTSTIAIRLVNTSTRYLVGGVWTASDSTAYVLGSTAAGVNTVIRYGSTDYAVKSVKAPRTRRGEVNHQELALDRI
jgi:hypothetical protein